MSFLDRITGKSRADSATDSVPPVPFDELEADLNPMTQTVRLRGAGGRDALAESTIISEAAPSELAQEFHETRQDGPASDDDDNDDSTGLPLISGLATDVQQRIVLGVFIAGLVLMVAVVFLALRASDRSAAQVDAAGRAQTQSQRLAKSISQALVGSGPAFVEVRESAAILAGNVRSLKDGSGDAPAVPDSLQELVDPMLPLVDRAEKNARLVLAQEKTLTQVNQALRAINRQSSDLLESAETLASLKQQQGASAAELNAVGQLVMLTQRIGKSANEFLTIEGVSPEAVFLLGKDLNTFRELSEGLDTGNPELRLNPTREPQARQALAQLISQYEQTRAQAGAILSNLQALVGAREAQSAILADSEPLRRGLDTLQQRLTVAGGRGAGIVPAGLLALLLLAAGGIGLLRLFVHDQTARAGVAEDQRVEAERQEQEAKRVNDANQAAILRLMNE
ncbi:MAG: type IV pili methyl-accepting chemotaxis transducer N-terminal domain-containing protein, partial [Rubrivivax sp.]